MKTKLTLSIEENIVEAAKEAARESGTSLSSVIENHLKLLLQNRKKKKDTDKVSPRVRKLRGVAKLDKSKNYKELRADMLEDKYGK